ncbi:MAG: hypothetical protein P8Y81_15670 [Ignavibacteriaceae bacterium]
MFKIIFFLFVFLWQIINAQEPPSSFGYLSTIKPMLSEPYDAHVCYNEKLTEIINENITEKIYPEEADFIPPIIRVMKTRLNQNSDEIFTVNFSPGPSADPGFIIQRISKDSSIRIDSFNCTNLVIPGNNCIYTSGHTNNMFNERKKFVYTGNGFREVRQAFYYVGLETINLKPITLFSDTTLSVEVAKLPANSEIGVLINLNDFYLIRTSFGLTGWLKLKAALYGYSPIKGLYYAGD